MARYGKAFELPLKWRMACASDMRVIGHRGAAGHVPENTIASVHAARALGAEGVEFDVRALDGALIVLHDATLERTTDGRGHYKDYDLTGLRALRTAAGEPIPLLAEMLDAAEGFDPVNVEVKEAGIADAVVDALEHHYADHPARLARVLLSSFDRATTARLAARRGRMQLGVLYENEPFAEALARAVALAADSLHLPLADLTPARVIAAHAAGLRVYVYTVNEADAIAACAAWGADGVFSDFPERVLEFEREHPPVPRP